jgi:hypothetical protein
MEVSYYHIDDLLYIDTGTPDVVSASLLDASGIVVHLATDDGYDIVGVTVMGASAYLPLGNGGYDVETDTLLMGRSTTDPKHITENGDIIGYWQLDEYDPSDGYRDPIGVALRHASVHLAKVSAELVGVPA